MKVLVTGSTGFVGSNLVPALLKKGYEVVKVNRYMTGRRSDGDTYVADMNDHQKIREVVAEVKPDYVCHLAAIAPVAYSYDHAMEVTQSNYTATVNLAEACRVAGVKHFLFAGSSEEYGNQTYLPITETATCKPNSPYAVAKLAADRYLHYIRDAYDFPMTVLRPFNTYGRVANANMVIERIISQMLTGEVVELGEPDPSRDFLYISDHVDAYLACLGNANAIGEAFNFCTGHAVRIDKLMELCARELDWHGDVRWHTIPKRPLDIDILVGDYAKASRVLSWKPKVSLEDGIKLTVKGMEESKEWRTVQSHS